MSRDDTTVNPLVIPTFSFRRVKNELVLSSNAEEIFDLDGIWPVGTKRPSVLKSFGQYPIATYEAELTVFSKTWNYVSPYEPFGNCLAPYSQKMFSEEAQARRDCFRAVTILTRLDESPMVSQEQISSAEVSAQSYKAKMLVLQTLALGLLNFSHNHLNVFRTHHSDSSKEYKGFLPQETPEFEDWIEPYIRGVGNRIRAEHYRVIGSAIDSICRIQYCVPYPGMDKSIRVFELTCERCTDECIAQTTSAKSAKMEVEAAASCPANWDKMSFADIIDRYLTMVPKKPIDSLHILGQGDSIDQDEGPSIDNDKQTKKRADPWAVEDWFSWDDDVAKGNIFNFIPTLPFSDLSTGNTSVSG